MSSQPQLQAQMEVPSAQGAPVTEQPKAQEQMQIRGGGEGEEVCCGCCAACCACEAFACFECCKGLCGDD